MNKTEFKRPPLESLACVHPECEMYGVSGQNNLIIRKIYGKNRIRYLRCRTCQSEFSERKGTALWNCKIDEEQAISIAEHLGEGCTFKGTARLVKVDPSTVRRLNRALGEHARAFHDAYAQDLEVDSLQADERYGFVKDKQTPSWEAEIIDPASKFIVSHRQGRRDSTLIRGLLEDGASRLKDRHDVVLFTDGEPSYASLFAEIFGVPYRSYRYSNRGRPPKVHYRIPRTLAHVQISKKRSGYKLKSIKIRYRHGTKRRAQDALYNLRHAEPNTAIIERRNGTARCMNAVQRRKTLAFSRHPISKQALGWWTLTVYNWCRENRMLKEPLEKPTDKKSTFRERLPWQSVFVIEL
jgi:IS1 family transposase/ribosomal protein L37AE/L43A